MRVRKSAIGSVMLIYWCSNGSSRLPAGLAEAGNVAAHRCFAQLGATQTELPIIAARAAGDRAALALATLARITRQRLQRRDRGFALRRRARRLANDFLQLRAPGGIGLFQVWAGLFAGGHR